jgi:phospholipid/cholesterol/gamma-HCH transport system substrate-binding protein
MNTNSRRDFVLGIVFFGTITALLYYTIILTGFSFSEKVHLTAYFPHAAGIKQGDSVLIAGHHSGTVRSVEYDNTASAETRISVDLEFDIPPTFHEGYLISISEFTVLGGRVVEIDPGPLDAPFLSVDAQLIGFVMPSPLASIGAVIDENREDLVAIIDNLRLVTDNIADGKGAIGALLSDESIATDLASAMKSARLILSDVNAGKGIIGSLINNEEQRETFGILFEDLKITFNDLRAITASVRDENGLIGAMLNDPTMRAEGMELVHSLAEVTSNFEQILGDARAGRSGLLGKFIGDDKIALEFQDLVSDMREVARRLEDGEGTIGRLLAEDDVYLELMESLKSLNGQLEDAREAQPVSTFTQMLFGSF